MLCLNQTDFNETKIEIKYKDDLSHRDFGLKIYFSWTRAYAFRENSSEA